MSGYNPYMMVAKIQNIQADGGSNVDHDDPDVRKAMASGLVAMDDGALVATPAGTAALEAIPGSSEPAEEQADQPPAELETAPEPAGEARE